MCHGHEGRHRPTNPMRVSHPIPKPDTHPQYLFIKGAGAALLAGGVTFAGLTWGVPMVMGGAGIGFAMFMVGYWLGYDDGEQMGNGKDHRGDSQSE
jgi:hypothetical protein